MLIAADAFDTYDDLNLWWGARGGGDGINLTGTLSRTGIGCCVLTQALGPGRAFVPISGLATGIVIGDAYFQNGNESSDSGGIFRLIDNVRTQLCGTMGVNGSLGVTVRDTFGNVVANSLPNIVVPNSYNYMEWKVFAGTPRGNNGTCIVRVNGAVVLVLTGIDFLDFGTTAINAMQLAGPGGLANARHDDFYLLDTTGATNNDFLGAVKIYACLPSANSAPLQFTPFAGTNFSEVNVVPPGGDTSYVFDGTVGQQDQYIYGVGAVPAGLTIFGAIHGLDARQASGSGSVASSVNGITAAGVGVGANYHFVVQQPYDTNPHTGLLWDLSDFPATVLGPKITA